MSGPGGVRAAWRAFMDAMWANRWGRVVLVIVSPVYAMAIMVVGLGAFSYLVGGIINGDWALAVLGLVGLVLFYVLFVPKR